MIELVSTLLIDMRRGCPGLGFLYGVLVSTLLQPQVSVRMPLRVCPTSTTTHCQTPTLQHAAAAFMLSSRMQDAVQTMFITVSRILFRVKTHLHFCSLGTNRLGCCTPFFLHCMQRGACTSGILLWLMSTCQVQQAVSSHEGGHRKLAEQDPSAVHLRQDVCAAFGGEGGLDSCCNNE